MPKMNEPKHENSPFGKNEENMNNINNKEPSMILLDKMPSSPPSDNKYWKQLQTQFLGKTAM